MQVYCPKCNTGYQIDDSLLNNKPHRLRCSNCGNIFKVEENIEAPLSTAEAFDNLSQMMQDDSAKSDEFKDANVEFSPDVAKFSDNEEIINSFSTAFAQQDSSTSESSDTSVNELTEDSPLANEDSSASELDKNNNTLPDEDSVNSSENKNSADPQTSDNNLAEETDTSSQSDSSDNNDNPDNNDPEKKSSELDLEQIFERLSENAEHLIAQEKSLPGYQKAWLHIKNILGFHFKIKWSYILFAFVIFISLSLFNNRYQIVRQLPFLNHVYKSLGIKAKVAGEGLEFQNINWAYIKNENSSLLEIKGFINNPTNRTIEIPTIHTEILGRDSSLLQSHNQTIEYKEIEASNKLPIKIIIKKPAPIAKYVYLTFLDNF